MARNSTDLYAKLQKAINTWSLLRPNKSFAGYTLEQFKRTVSPSLDLRKQVEESDAHTRQLMAQRDDANVLSRKALQRLIHGIIADADEGEDGELYVAMGYMPRSARSALQSAGRAKNAKKPAALAPQEESSVSRREGHRPATAPPEGGAVIDA